MKYIRMTRTLSMVVAILFFVNNIAFGLGTALTSSDLGEGVRPGTRERMQHAGGQKLFAYVRENEKGRGRLLDCFFSFKDLITPRDLFLNKEFTGTAPAIENVEFLPESSESKPLPPLEGNPLYKEKDLISALKYFRDNEAKIPEGELDIREEYFEVDEKEGELPLARIEENYPGTAKTTYTLVVHPKFVQMWNHIRENDVQFYYTFPDGTIRRTSVAWGIFFRLAKHEMKDLEDKGGTLKGGGHLGTQHLDSVTKEDYANNIGGRYSTINDGIWLWFLQSYSFRDATRYNNYVFAERLHWFFYDTKEAIKKLGLWKEFPWSDPGINTAVSKYVKKQFVCNLARAINYHFFSRKNIKMPQWGRKIKKNYEEIKKAMRIITDESQTVADLEALHEIAKKAVEAASSLSLHDSLSLQKFMINGSHPFSSFSGDANRFIRIIQYPGMPDLIEAQIEIARIKPTTDKEIKTAVDIITHESQTSYGLDQLYEIAKKAAEGGASSLQEIEKQLLENLMKVSYPGRPSFSRGTTADNLIRIIQNPGMLELIEAQKDVARKKELYVERCRNALDDDYYANKGIEKEAMDIMRIITGKSQTETDLRELLRIARKAARVAFALEHPEQQWVEKFMQRTPSGFSRDDARERYTIILATIEHPGMLDLIEAQIKVAEIDVAKIGFPFDKKIESAMRIITDESQTVAKLEALHNMMAEKAGENVVHFSHSDREFLKYLTENEWSIDDETEFIEILLEPRILPAIENQIKILKIKKTNRSPDQQRDDYLERKAVVIKDFWAASGKDAPKEHPLIRVISQWIVRAGFEHGPASGVLSTTDTTNIYETVNLLNDNQIEIIMPQFFEITETIKKAIRDINRRTGVKRIKLTQFSDVKHLETLLGRKCPPGMKRIVITGNRLKNRLNRLVEKNPGLFQGKRLLNIQLPSSYSKMTPRYKTLHQSRTIMIAILARLLEKEDTPRVEAILKEMLKDHLDIGGNKWGEFVNNLTDSEKTDSTPEEIKTRIKYFLGKVIRLVGILGKEIRLMKRFWVSA